ncbi:MAG: hypothetical protein MJZ33_03455 [Paludibacteraceae bacterium]|nr:hypothetical protein [Paludibacteraceae bacterium]
MNTQNPFHYYHGESTCPYSLPNNRLFWLIEKRCVRNGSDEYEGWLEYYRIKGYKQYDDVPYQILISLFLYWLDDDDKEEETVADFYGLVEEYRSQPIKQE